LLCENAAVNDDRLDHVHMWSVSIGGDMTDPEQDQWWTAQCRVCGRTESSDDAESQLALALRKLALPSEDADPSSPHETP
jgi:hypothetical protein